jgi:hypothetical protein
VDQVGTPALWAANFPFMGVLGMVHQGITAERLGNFF